MDEKYILDVCCGGRLMWFDKDNKNTIFCDKNPLVIEVAGREWDKKHGSWEFEINARDFGLTNYKKILVEPVGAHDIILPIKKIKEILKAFI